MPTAATFPTTFCWLRSENSHQENDGPGFDSQHLQGLPRSASVVVGDEIILVVQLDNGARPLDRVAIEFGGVHLSQRGFLVASESLRPL